MYYIIMIHIEWRNNGCLLICFKYIFCFLLMRHKSNNYFLKSFLWCALP
jgi:hypothetical protein